MSESDLELTSHAQWAQPLGGDVVLFFMFFFFYCLFCFPVSFRVGDCVLAAHIVASLSFIFLVNISILLCESCGMITGNPSPGKQLGCLFGFYYVETQCTGIQRTLERIIPPAQWYGSAELFMWYAHGWNTAETHKGQPKGLLNQGTFKAKLERDAWCALFLFSN